MGLTPEETWGGDEPPRPDNESSRPATERQKTPQTEARPVPPTTPAPTEKLFPANLADGISRDTQVSLIIVLLTICALLLAWNTFKPATKWEYKIEAVSDLGFETTINNIGSDGWELVFARRVTSSSGGPDEKQEFSYEMMFKRPAK